MTTFSDNYEIYKKTATDHSYLRVAKINLGYNIYHLLSKKQCVPEKSFS